MLLMSALLVVAPAVGSSDQRVLPSTELSDFTGTEARSLDDYLGQPLLVDFFAHWCQPCAVEVAHLNQLADDFGPKGLNIIGVTGDDPDTAKSWLERNHAKYPHALDPKLKLQIELGFQPLPFAVLADATGVIVWEGNPAKLEDETIVALLGNQIELPAYRWPAETAPVRDALKRGRYDDARRATDALLTMRTELIAFVDRMIERRRHLMQVAFDHGDFLTADELAAQLESGLAEGVAKTRATEMRARIAKDEHAVEIKAALARLRKEWDGVAGLVNKKAADDLAERLRALAKEHAGTIVEQRVQAYLQTLSAFRALLQ